MMTDEVIYRVKLMEGTLFMFGFFAFVGMTARSIYHIYYKKNKINEFRIRSKY